MDCPSCSFREPLGDELLREVRHGTRAGVPRLQLREPAEFDFCGKCGPRGRRRDLKRVISEVEARLAAGRGVVIFPEGTSTKGDAVQPFKASVFEVPIRTGTPVSYAALHYHTPEGAPPAHVSVCWWGDMPFVPHLMDLLALPSVRATVTFGPEPVLAADRKSLAVQARRAVQAEFIPV